MKGKKPDSCKASVSEMRGHFADHRGLSFKFCLSKSPLNSYLGSQEREGGVQLIDPRAYSSGWTPEAESK